MTMNINNNQEVDFKIEKIRANPVMIDGKLCDDFTRKPVQALTSITETDTHKIAEVVSGPSKGSVFYFQNE